MLLRLMQEEQNTLEISREFVFSFIVIRWTVLHRVHPSHVTQTGHRMHPKEMCCVLSGRGLCDGLITRPEEPYRLWHIVVCDQKTLKTRRLKPATGLWKIQPQWVVTPRKQTNKQSLPVVTRTKWLQLVYVPNHSCVLPSVLELYCLITHQCWLWYFCDTDHIPYRYLLPCTTLILT